MAYEILEANLPATPAVSIRAEVPTADLAAFFTAAFAELAEAIRTGGAERAGPPFIRYYSVSRATVDLEAVMPCSEAVLSTGRVHPIQLEASPAAVVRHAGGYDVMKPAYDAITQWLRDNGKEPREAPREVYVTSPAEVSNPEEWVTLVEQPFH